jgi:DNA modification methylase
MKTLNYQVAKEAQDEKHICPLQLDLVERAIRLWTNPGDVVLDPFAGIGSVPFKAVEMGRRGVGFELKQSYFNWACRYLSDAERLQKTETLFGRAGVATPAR